MNKSILAAVILAFLAIASAFGCDVCSEEDVSLEMVFERTSYKENPQGGPPLAANAVVRTLLEEKKIPIINYTVVPPTVTHTNPFEIRCRPKKFSLHIEVPSIWYDGMGSGPPYDASGGYHLVIEVPCGVKQVNVKDEKYVFPPGDGYFWKGENIYGGGAHEESLYAAVERAKDNEGKVTRRLYVNWGSGILQSNSSDDNPTAVSDILFEFKSKADGEQAENADPLESNSNPTSRATYNDDGEVEINVSAESQAPDDGDGDQSGTLNWEPEDLSESTSIDSVAFVAFSGGAGGVLVTSSTNSDRKQVYVAGGGAANIVKSGNQLSILLYDTDGLGTLGGDGLYTVSGTARKEVRITDNSGVISYKVFKDGSLSSEYNLEQSGSNSISRTNVMSGRKDVTTAEADGDEHMVTKEIWDVSPSPDKLLKKTVTVTKDFPWGSEVITEIEDPDGEARTTSYTYHEDEELDGYAKLQSVTYPDGNWERYAYDSEGRIIVEYRPFKDLPATAAEATDDVGQLVFRTFTDEKLTAEQSLVYETETNLEAFVYTTGTDTVTSGTLNITTQTSQPAGGPETIRITREFGADEKLHSIDFEDGRRDSYTYEKGDYEEGEFTPDEEGEFERTTITHGTTTNPEGVTWQLARETRIENSDGKTMREEKQVYTEEEEYETIEVVEYQYDEDGNLEETTKNGRVTYSATYFANGKVDTEADEQGIETSYTYEGDNIKTSTKKGVSSATINSVNYPAQADIVTTYEYDLLGRQVSEIVSSGTLSLPARTTTYTVGGDIASQTEGGLTTSYSYEYGGRKTTVTQPNGGTEITENYLDGRTKSIMGTGVVHQFFDYGSHESEGGYTDGTLWTTVRVADDESPRWEKTTTDGSGRHLRTERPTFDHSGTNTFASSYNNKGQLIKEQRTGLGDMVFSYNSLGQMSRRGQDMNGNGTLTTASMDRIFDSYDEYYADGETAAHYSYTDEYYIDNSGSYTVTVQTAGEDLMDPTYAVKRDFSVNGYSVAEKSEIFREDKVERRIGSFSDSGTESSELYRNGLLQRQTTKYTEEPTVYSYDAFGREIARVVPIYGGVTTATAYSVTTGQVASVATGTTGPSSTYEYYPSGSGANTGRLKKVTENGRSTYYAWTLRGEIYRQWGAVYPAEFEYDDYGQLVTMKTYRGGSSWQSATWPGSPGDSDLTTWLYDSYTGLLIKKIDDDDEDVEYEWNDANQLSGVIVARDIAATYGYNAAGELTSKTYADATPAVTLVYNRRGLPVSITDGSGVRTRTYTAYKQLELETAVSGVLPAGWVTSRTYGTDSATIGQLRMLSVVGSGTVYSGTFGYGAQGLLASATALSVSGQPTLTYADMENATAKQTLHFNVSGTGSPEFSVELGPDETLRNLYTWTDTFAAADGYVEGANGQLNNHQQISLLTFQDDTRWEFTYNDRGEVYEATRFLSSGPLAPSEYNQWLYDNQGNREEYSTALLDWTDYTVNTMNQYTKIETSTSAEEDFAHDIDGNRTQDGSWDYKWDAENRLVSMQTSAAAVTGGATPKKLVFVYDSENRRVSKTVLTLSGTAFTNVVSHKAFIYDGWRPIVEVSYSGTTPSVAKTYHWGLDVAGLQDGQSVEGAGGIGGLWLMQSGSTAYFPMNDPMGNVIALAETGSNTKAATYRYGPFGETLVSSGTAASLNPLRFQTQYLDEETGLYYWKNRYYDPAVGRWLNRDPIGWRGGINLYSYVENDPLNVADPLGFAGKSYDPNDPSSWILIQGIWLEGTRGNGPFLPAFGSGFSDLGIIHYRNGTPILSAHPAAVIDGQVHIVILEDWNGKGGDSKEASKLLKQRMPVGDYVWHHEEMVDVNGKKGVKMVLVPRALNSIPHAGPASWRRAALRMGAAAASTLVRGGAYCVKVAGVVSFVLDPGSAIAAPLGGTTTMGDATIEGYQARMLERQIADLQTIEDPVMYRAVLRAMRINYQESKWYAHLIPAIDRQLDILDAYPSLYPRIKYVPSTWESY